MDKQKVNIIYKYYVPEELIKEFELELQKEGFAVNPVKDEESVNNLEGPELSDIVVFIKDNPYSIFLAPALYDVVKFGLGKLWRGILKLNVKKVTPKSTEPKNKKLSVRYEDANGKKIRINIEGNIDEESVERAIEKCLNILISDKKKDLFDEPNFVDNSLGIEEVELNYNPDTETWEPVNFGDYRKKSEQLWREALKKFDS